ncbi:hypothetical protein ACG33_06665 [Steroidobacter denitrificans]|uniref:Uncharacterized protein n=1 Tax=Steroidobacter denitrificans TaxID=465721 RepID=A0A127F8N3_STEDE|nr:hypothetical protein [Steroidobacter denitrificans]AMN46784.1 hypothetical protein ACG33_06665 [Steroidobacter denitrificans]
MNDNDNDNDNGLAIRLFGCSAAQRFGVTAAGRPDRCLGLRQAWHEHRCKQAQRTAWVDTNKTAPASGSHPPMNVS